MEASGECVGGRWLCNPQSSFKCISIDNLYQKAKGIFQKHLGISVKVSLLTRRTGGPSLEGRVPQRGALPVNLAVPERVPAPTVTLGGTVVPPEGSHSARHQTEEVAKVAPRNPRTKILYTHTHTHTYMGTNTHTTILGVLHNNPHMYMLCIHTYTRTHAV